MSENILIEHGRKAELRRGLRFIERFNNSSHVLANGGVITGTPIFNNDNSLTFDNTLNQILCYSDNLSVGEDSFTVRFKAKDLVGKVGDVSELVGTRAWATGNEVGWSLGISSNTLIWLHYSDGVNFVDATLGAGYNIGSIATYTDIAVTFTRGGNAEVFIDGVSKGTRSIAAVTGSATSTEPLCIMSDDTNNTRDTSGTIKDIQIFREILTDSEILAYADGSMWEYNRNRRLFGACSGDGLGVDLAKYNTLVPQTVNFPTAVIGLNGQPCWNYDGVNGRVMKLGTSLTLTQDWTITIYGCFTAAHTTPIFSQRRFSNPPLVWDQVSIFHRIIPPTQLRFSVVNATIETATDILWNWENQMACIALTYKHSTGEKQIFVNGELQPTILDVNGQVPAIVDTLDSILGGNPGALNVATGRYQELLFHLGRLNQLQAMDQFIYLIEFKIP